MIKIVTKQGLTMDDWRGAINFLKIANDEQLKTLASLLVVEVETRAEQ